MKRHDPDHARRGAAAVLACSVGLLGALVGAMPACGDAAEPDVARAAYLMAQGTWTLDAREPSYSDARNPKRLVLATPETPNSPSVFSFFADIGGTTPIAEGCRYQYNRSQPDSVRFPANKDAVWVIFDLEPDSATACQAFARVAFMPTADGRAGLQLRYGDLDYDVLVGPDLSEPSSPDLWWSVYRPVAGTRATDDFPYAVANGERVADATSPATVDDERNPSRIVMTTSAEAGSESRFVFYRHGAPDTVWADCNFQVRYTMPDPRAFPADKMALWDAFEMTHANSGACEVFTHVVMSWVDGDAAMHLRYGTDDFVPLLTESLAGDGAWWARYCAPSDREGCGTGP